MKATFVELPPFQRVRPDYLNDEAYRKLQMELLANPHAGDVIEGTGGLRKIRQADDLTQEQRKTLKRLLESELQNRQTNLG